MVPTYPVRRLCNKPRSGRLKPASSREQDLGNKAPPFRTAARFRASASRSAATLTGSRSHTGPPAARVNGVGERLRRPRLSNVAAARTMDEMPVEQAFEAPHRTRPRSRIAFPKFSDEQQIISGRLWHVQTRQAFTHHEKAASQVYSSGGEGPEMKSNRWGTILGKVLVCFLLLAGVIAISAGAGLAEERNYSVAALGTSASSLSDTAQSTTFQKLRKDQKVAASRPCTVGSTTGFCDGAEVCCARDGRPVCCVGGCGALNCR
jgi:hypothetical protein